MRKLSWAFVCVALLVGLSCQKKEEVTPVPSPAAAAQAQPAVATPTPICVAGSGNKNVCTVTLTQTDDACSVDPSYLEINSGDKVIFKATDFTRAQAAKFEDKAPPTVQFALGKPDRIPKKDQKDSGAITGPVGASYKYTVQFKTVTKDLCHVDPVICIKGGILEDTCN